MDIDLLLKLSYILVPICLSAAGYFVRAILKRLDVVEAKLEKTITESEVRQLLADKIEPLREDVLEIKRKIDRIFDLLLNLNK